MKIKCDKCGIQDCGRYKKLVERGWKMFFISDGIRATRCKKCKPTLKDKLKSKFNKDYHPEMYYDIKESITKIKILRGLKTKEEKVRERVKRNVKKRKKYHYQRNIHEKKGSKKYG